MINFITFNVHKMVIDTLKTCSIYYKIFKVYDYFVDTGSYMINLQLIEDSIESFLLWNQLKSLRLAVAVLCHGTEIAYCVLIIMYLFPKKVKTSRPVTLDKKYREQVYVSSKYKNKQVFKNSLT